MDGKCDLGLELCPLHTDLGLKPVFWDYSKPALHQYDSQDYLVLHYPNGIQHTLDSGD